MRLLLTGGAGFIGSHLAKRLIREGHEVTIIDNLSSGQRDNIPPQARFAQTDLSTTDFVNSLPKGPFEAVCHLAAQSSGPASGENPLYDVQTNALSTLLLSRWCLVHQVPRFLFASSMAVYGNLGTRPATESTPCQPLSYYGISKLTSEHFLRLAALEGLQSTSFRMFSVYGPGQNLDNLKQGMVSIYLAYLLKKQEVPVTGSLERFRDFVFIDDAVEAWVRALSRPSTSALTYNVGSGQPTTVRTLLGLLLGALGLPENHPLRELPGSASDQFGVCAAIGSIQKDLGWKPPTPLEEGIRKMVEWARSVTPSSKRIAP
jgi:UDP-glucose 4-epimerase